MAISTRTLERSIWIDAPRTAVWDAIGTAESMGRWLLPASLGATMSREGDRLSVDIGGFMTAEVAAIDALDPPQRLSMRGLPDGVLAIALALVEEGGRTRVTVVMAGFEALELDAVDDRIAVSGPAWDQALENLKALVEGVELPHAEPPVAALFGYRRQAATTIAVVRSIWIAAPRERVWDAIYEPEQIQAWFSPGTPWRKTGDGVGARVAVYDPTTGEDTHVQVIEASEPPHRLVTRSEAAHGLDSQLTEWLLSEEGTGTRLTITLSGYEAQALETRETSIEQNAFGFGMMLLNLRAFVDGSELPFPGGF